VATDLFAGMLDPDEQILASFQAWGPELHRPDGNRKVWYRVALTQGRFLLIRMVEQPGNGSFAPEARLGVGRAFLRLRLIPACQAPPSPAHLEIDGCGEHVSLLHVDSAEMRPSLDAFLEAWHGRSFLPTRSFVGQAPEAPEPPAAPLPRPVEATRAPLVPPPPRALPHKPGNTALWVVLGLGGVLAVLCAGCMGAGILTQIVAGMGSF
jgi:hypothetical protein